jgi:hypothetical protein
MSSGPSTHLSGAFRPPGTFLIHRGPQYGMRKRAKRSFIRD